MLCWKHIFILCLFSSKTQSLNEWNPPSVMIPSCSPGVVAEFPSRINTHFMQWRLRCVGVYIRFSSSFIFIFTKASSFLHPFYFKYRIITMIFYRWIGWKLRCLWTEGFFWDAAVGNQLCLWWLHPQPAPVTAASVTQLIKLQRRNKQSAPRGI